jgi:hypothetical protein
VNWKSIDPEEKINSSDLSPENKEFFIWKIKAKQEEYRNSYGSELPLASIEIIKSNVTVVGKSKIVPGPTELSIFDKASYTQETKFGYPIRSDDGWEVYLHVDRLRHWANVNRTKTANLLPIDR